ncbi:PucR family transcriptional regulator [Nakamurella deserti]|uniref:PucR family transcriptional regulator n=1 Tax=Nakamurella deserti TaxID=2164074 RepID=UPI000DBE9F2E|nr:PucR family transcriptional regulator [Nakamurella deserti]
MDVLPAGAAQVDGGAIADDLRLDETTVTLLLARLPDLAAHTVRAITEEVPAYRAAFAGPLGATITSAVEVALRGFLRLASQPAADPAADGRTRTPALDGAYDLGRGEARGGRTMDALLAAYRAGTREAWREFSRTALETGVSARGMAWFAELVFAYIDGLSAASAAGHADELAISGRVRERYLSQLGLGVVTGEPADRLEKLAERAGWRPPATFSVVVLPGGQAARAMAALDGRTLRIDDDLPDLTEDEQSDLSVLLVADAAVGRRPAVLRSLDGLDAHLGPARPWTQARVSYLRALRARRWGLRGAGVACDTDEHLPALVVTADPEALADLQARVLAPLAGLRPTTAHRLTETLRAWLLHQGRREDVAAALHVHPQTVRYRLGQLREHFGSRWDDPDEVAALTVALVVPPETPAGDDASDGGA